MREISFDEIVSKIESLCLSANVNLADGIVDCYQKALETEESVTAKSIISDCIENQKIAFEEKVPLCQDTGLAVFFIKLGDEIKIKDGLLSDAVEKGVALGYTRGYLRASCLSDPLYDRKNTRDNTPPIIHTETVSGDKLEITFIPKGGGAENMSALKMMSPSAGEKGVIDFVVDTVKNAGGNPCPPVVIGVGIGSNFEGCALLAKKALLREIGKHNADPRYKALEEKLLTLVNETGIGPQGFGGKTTAFDLHIEYAPCHLASLPVAVNINCHIHRKQTVII